MSKRNTLSAFEVVNHYSYDDLRNVLFEYGDIRNANAMAKVIVSSRETEAIRTTDALKEALKQFLPEHKQHKILAQIYQEA